MLVTAQSLFKGYYAQVFGTNLVGKRLLETMRLRNGAGLKAYVERAKVEIDESVSEEDLKDAERLAESRVA